MAAHKQYGVGTLLEMLKKLIDTRVNRVFSLVFGVRFVPVMFSWIPQNKMINCMRIHA
jgi:hypothetical protein